MKKFPLKIERANIFIAKVVLFQIVSVFLTRTVFNFLFIVEGK